MKNREPINRKYLSNQVKWAIDKGKAKETSDKEPTKAVCGGILTKEQIFFVSIPLCRSYIKQRNLITHIENAKKKKRLRNHRELIIRNGDSTCEYFTYFCGLYLHQVPTMNSVIVTVLKSSVWNITYVALSKNMSSKYKKRIMHCCIVFIF